MIELACRPYPRLGCAARTGEVAESLTRFGNSDGFLEAIRATRDGRSTPGGGLRHRTSGAAMPNHSCEFGVIALDRTGTRHPVRRRRWRATTDRSSSSAATTDALT